MSNRKVHAAPTFSRVDDPKALDRLVLEIIKLKPEVEVSIEGSHEVLRGRILEWNRTRKLFTVSWKKMSEEFNERTASLVGLRTYFKVKLFTTQLVFRTETVRRLPDGSFHYRFPDEFFQQQRRGALRVPIKKAFLKSKEGRFAIEDLSVGGAKIIFDPSQYRNLHVLHDCKLQIQGTTLNTEPFTATLTHRNDHGSGSRFSGLTEGMRSEIKQVLIDALRTYYQELT